MNSKKDFLKFEVNDIHLSTYSLAHYRAEHLLHSGSEYDHLKAYRNFAWNLSKDLYRFVIGESPLFYLPSYLNIEKLEGLGRELNEYLSSLIAAEEYNRLKEDTDLALTKIKQEWLVNFERSILIMSQATGLNFEDSLLVYVTHPAMKQGRYLGDGIVAWTFRNDWPNYNTVYLWHEILHHYQPISTAADLTCSLLADHYLKFSLNNQGEVADFIGKPDQIDIVKQNYEKLVDYLQGREVGNINEIREWFTNL